MTGHTDGSFLNDDSELFRSDGNSRFEFGSVIPRCLTGVQFGSVIPRCLTGVQFGSVQSVAVGSAAAPLCTGALHEHPRCMAAPSGAGLGSGPGSPRHQQRSVDRPNVPPKSTGAPMYRAGSPRHGTAPEEMASMEMAPEIWTEMAPMGCRRRAAGAAGGGSAARLGRSPSLGVQARPLTVSRAPCRLGGGGRDAGRCDVAVRVDGHVAGCVWVARGGHGPLQVAASLSLSHAQTRARVCTHAHTHPRTHARTHLSPAPSRVPRNVGARRRSPRSP